MTHNMGKWYLVFVRKQVLLSSDAIKCSWFFIDDPYPPSVNNSRQNVFNFTVVGLVVYVWRRLPAS